MNKLMNITAVCKILKLIDPKTKKPQNHVLRYWEKEFFQIKPKKINNRRYYSIKDIQTIKTIKFLLKDQKISISGVKNILKSNTLKLDGDDVHSLKNDNLKNYFKFKSKSILKKIVDLKNYGKKISS